MPRINYAIRRLIIGARKARAEFLAKTKTLAPQKLLVGQT